MSTPPEAVARLLPLLQAVEQQLQVALTARDLGYAPGLTTALELLSVRVSALHRTGLPELAQEVATKLRSHFPDHPVVARMNRTILTRAGLQRSCKICGRASEYFATLMPYKSGPAPESLGPHWTVNYHQCFFCGYLFTGELDGWSMEDFSSFIYNEGYHQVDPDFEFTRPRSQADHFIYKLRDWGSRVSVLDYGGGKGTFAQLMRQEGFDVTSCDPIYADSMPEPHHQYDLITCNEVWEHVPDPHALVTRLDGYLKEDGVIWIGTHRVPDDIEALGTSWWYFAPRNGHISFYTRWAFEMLLAQHGFQYASTVDFTHLGFRRRTPLAARLDHP